MQEQWPTWSLEYGGGGTEDRIRDYVMIRAGRFYSIRRVSFRTRYMLCTYPLTKKRQL